MCYVYGSYLCRIVCDLNDFLYCRDCILYKFDVDGHSTLGFRGVACRRCVLLCGSVSNGWYFIRAGKQYV